MLRIPLKFPRILLGGVRSGGVVGVHAVREQLVSWMQCGKDETKWRSIVTAWTPFQLLEVVDRMKPMFITDDQRFQHPPYRDNFSFIHFFSLVVIVLDRVVYCFIMSAQLYACFERRFINVESTEQQFCSIWFHFRFSLHESNNSWNANTPINGIQYSSSLRLYCWTVDFTDACLVDFICFLFETMCSKQQRSKCTEPNRRGNEITTRK